MRLTRKEERYIKKREVEPPISNFSVLEREIKNTVLEWERKQMYERQRAKEEEMRREEERQRKRREEINRFMNNQYHGR